MSYTALSDQVTVSGQIHENELAALKEQGVELLICNRPDGEAEDQPPFKELAIAAEKLGIKAQHIPFSGGAMTPSQVDEFKALVDSYARIHAFCRTGNRSTNIWKAAMANSAEQSSAAGQATASHSGLAQTQKHEVSANKKVEGLNKKTFDVVIVGAGSGGIAVAASLLKRQANLRLALIDPAKDHYYQPGWTMVGGGVFSANSTRAKMQNVIPHGVTWLQSAVTQFNPDQNFVELKSGEHIYYQQLVVTPGLSLRWDAIEGLEETLGKNGVTSNYRYDLAPYTWQLVSNLKSGKAVFTQPPMPIKCAGAPQKAMYLSADHWRKHGRLDDIDVQFYNAGPVLFGVKDYVPTLESYIQRYGTQLNLKHKLVKVDGPNRVAWFTKENEQGESETVMTSFDMLHVCPQQSAPDFIQTSPLSDANGWLDVDQYTLQHKQFANIWGLGDVINAPNAKTMAAARKQAPVVAQNLVDSLNGNKIHCAYDGYGSCPLTVERGKIVLAEFGYGGKLLPTFPSWLNNGTHATRLAWLLKSQFLPEFYWRGMLKGHEWFAHPMELQDVAK